MSLIRRYNKESVLPLLKILKRSNDTDDDVDQLKLGILMIDHSRRSQTAFERLSTYERDCLAAHLIGAISYHENYSYWAPFMRFTLERLCENWQSVHGHDGNSSLTRPMMTSKEKSMADLITMIYKRYFKCKVLLRPMANPNTPFLQNYASDQPPTGFAALLDDGT